MPFLTPVSFRSGPKVFLKEGFEGAGYENAVWTEGGTPNENYTTSPIEGAESLSIATSAATEYVYTTVDDKNTLHGYFRFRRNTGSGTILAVRVGTGTAIAYFSTIAGPLLEMTHGSVTKTISAAFNININYHIWFSIRLGSGSDGFIDVAFSADEKKPEVGSSNRAVITNGTGTGTFNRIYLAALASSTLTYIYDSVKFSDSEIPSILAEDQTPCFLREDFEVTGYENIWTEDGTGTINEDYTTAPLVGSQSLNLVGATTAPRTYYAFPARTTINGYFQIKRNSATGTVMFMVLRSGTTNKAFIEFVSDSIRISHGSASSTAVTTISSGVIYHVWFTVTMGVGSDGFADVAFSTDGIKPAPGSNNRATVTIGTSTGTFDRFNFGTTVNETMDVVFDKVRLSDYEISHNPN